MSDNSTEAKPATEITVKRSPYYRTIVADLFNARVGPGACTIVCGRIVHEPETPLSPNIFEEQAEIMLSWGTLKMMAMNLMELVVAMEQEIGPIPIPKKYTEMHHLRYAGHLAAIRNLNLVLAPVPYAGAPEAASESHANHSS